MALLPLFQFKDATVMQWQTRWKALLDPLLQRKINSTTVQLPLGIVIVTGPSAPDVIVGSGNFSSTGGQVLLNLQSNSQATENNPATLFWTYFASGAPATPIFSAEVLLFRDNVLIQVANYYFDEPSLTIGETADLAMPLAMTCIDSPPAGLHVYSVAINANGSQPGNTQFYLLNGELVITELT
jgi:hypothetical protein